MPKSPTIILVRVYDLLAASVLRIECEGASGSGFHFRSAGTVVTCFHVVEEAPDQVEAFTERGTWSLEFVSGSPRDQLDYAIYRVCGNPPASPFLLPAERGPTLGQEVIYGGFPHGIPDLMLQKATVAGYESDESFYLDGSINAGNSGGPIVDATSGEVIGLVTDSRFPYAGDLEAMADEASDLQAYCADLTGSAGIMGIDFGRFAENVAKTNLLLSRLLEANANCGIGIALGINSVIEELDGGG